MGCLNEKIIRNCWVVCDINTRQKFSIWCIAWHSVFFIYIFGYTTHHIIKYIIIWRVYLVFYVWGFTENYTKQKKKHQNTLKKKTFFRGLSCVIIMFNKIENCRILYPFWKLNFDFGLRSSAYRINFLRG